MSSHCFIRSTTIRLNSFGYLPTRLFATLQLLSAKCAYNECLNLGVQSNHEVLVARAFVFSYWDVAHGPSRLSNVRVDAGAGQRQREKRKDYLRDELSRLASNEL